MAGRAILELNWDNMGDFPGQTVVSGKSLGSHRSSERGEKSSLQRKYDPPRHGGCETASRKRSMEGRE